MYINRCARRVLEVVWTATSWRRQEVQPTTAHALLTLLILPVRFYENGTAATLELSLSGILILQLLKTVFVKSN